MNTVFENAIIEHISGKPNSHKAAAGVLPPEGFAAAIEEISQWQGYEPTPLFSLTDISSRLSLGEVLYKDEGPRFGLGSFKALGGSYAALRVLQREISQALNDMVSLEDIRNGKYSKEASKITLVSATDGNHGRSLAWGCQRFGAPCKIYIHAEVSEGRATAMRDLGAEVIRIDGDYDDSVDLARSEAEKNNWFVVSDTSWPGYCEPPRDVMHGYGVMMHEINESLTEPPTHIFIQAGCGGFAGSVCASIRQYWGEHAPRIVIVEPNLANCLFESSKANKALFVKINEESIMAGLSCGEASALAWDVIAEEASDFVTIPENVVAPTVRLLARPEGNDAVIEAGESAVAGLAALICAAKQSDVREQLGLNESSRVLLFGSEGVTDRAI
ncbi:MAG: diaminopropionate ammonia-lyase, partial [Gammaproteobacteria bacterium]